MREASSSAANYSPWLKASAAVMKGKYDKADAVDPNFLNHVTWYSATDWKRPYPGESKVRPPSEFKNPAPAGDLDDN